MTCIPHMLALCASLHGVPAVIDGDTLRFPTHTVRLQGIDAEERHEPYGPSATQALRRIVAGTAYIQCIPSGTVSHTRVVATCYTAEGYDVAAMLVEQGYALDCARYSQGRYRQFEPHGVRLRLTSKHYCDRRSTR
jgi:endonuclease YncB( thermonuclease family)